MERLHKLDALFNSDQINSPMQQKPHPVQFPCTEQTIIDLHALLINPGIHHIEFETFEKGRMLLEALLASLNCYNSIACITTRKLAFTISIYDCSYDLAAQSCIEIFFTDYFFFDCMIIEPSITLETTSWYRRAERYLYTSTISREIPVIIAGYQNPC